MSKNVIGLGLAALLSFSSFAAVAIAEPSTVECGGEEGKKKNKKKKSCCKKGSKECSKDKTAQGTKEEIK